MKWISVKDKLPKIIKEVDMSKPVLVISIRAIKTCYCEEYPYIDIDRLHNWSDTKEISFSIDRFKYGAVTHWAYLPRFPNETLKKFEEFFKNTY